MCNKNSKCDCWISLSSLGVNAEGCLKDSKWLFNLNIPCTQSPINPSILVNNGITKLTFIKNVSHGNFGSIDLGVFENNGVKKEVYIKRPIKAEKNLIYEACIQKVVGEHLEKIGFPNGAPKIVYIFRLHDNSVCFAMDPIPNSTTLSELLDISDKSTNFNIILDCLLQLCGMIWYLDNVLGINHRDLKPSNFLVCQHSPEKKVIVVEDEIIEINSKYSITFIDFGFSCLGSTKTQIADLSLSSVYSQIDPCPKEGRDMYLFLSFLYIEYYNKLSNEILLLLEQWLAIPNTNMIKFLKKYGIKSKEWVYFLTGNPDIKQFNSTPYKIIKDLNTYIN